MDTPTSPLHHSVPVEMLDVNGRYLIGRQAITTDQGTYEPWSNGFAVGFRFTPAAGRPTYIYLNPSRSDGGGVPNVFLYIGEHGDASMDPAAHHYLMGPE